MLTQVQLEAFEKLSPIPEMLEHDVLKRGIKTGSAVYGGFVDGSSDIDILMNQDTMNFTIEDYAPHAIGPAGAGNSGGDNADTRSLIVKCSTITDPMNIIFCRDAEVFRAWVDTTNCLILMSKLSEELRNLMQSRAVRVAIFYAIRTTLLEEK